MLSANIELMIVAKTGTRKKYEVNCDAGMWDRILQYNTIPIPLASITLYPRYSQKPTVGSMKGFSKMKSEGMMNTPPMSDCSEVIAMTFIVGFHHLNKA